MQVFWGEGRGGASADAHEASPGSINSPWPKPRSSASSINSPWSKNLHQFTMVQTREDLQHSINPHGPNRAASRPWRGAKLCQGGTFGCKLSGEGSKEVFRRTDRILKMLRLLTAELDQTLPRWHTWMQAFWGRDLGLRCTSPNHHSLFVLRQNMSRSCVISTKPPFGLFPFSPKA